MRLVRQSIPGRKWRGSGTPAVGREVIEQRSSNINVEVFVEEADFIHPGPALFLFNERRQDAMTMDRVTRDQFICVEAVRLWRRGNRMRRMTMKLMAKYGLDASQARTLAKVARDVYRRKSIPS
jgi:hypothetical protein